MEHTDNSQAQHTEHKKPRKTLYRKIAIIALVVVTVASATFVYIQMNSSNDAETIGNTKEFEPGDNYLLPSTKSIENLGGWRRVSPPKNALVFAYSDKIGSVGINVSQQELPESFKDNTAKKIEELAKGYNATNVIEAGDTIAYIGTNAKGPQSVIFTKNNLLIMIVSEKQIDDKEWSQYIKSLYSPSGLPRF